jgi:hypothetical protein
MLYGVCLVIDNIGDMPPPRPRLCIPLAWLGRRVSIPFLEIGWRMVLLYADIELFCMTRGVLFLDGHIGISIPHAWRLPYPESRDSSLKKFGSKYSQGDFYD